jgi:hypothetical protein
LYVLAGHGLAGPQSDAASDKPAGPPRSAPLTLALRVRLTSGGLDYAPHAILVQPCARFVPGVWGRCYFQSIEGTRERGERAGAAGDQTRETLRHEVEACTNSRRRAFETRITVHPRLTHLDLIASTVNHVHRGHETAWLARASSQTLVIDQHAVSQHVLTPTNWHRTRRAFGRGGLQKEHSTRKPNQIWPLRTKVRQLPYDYLGPVHTTYPLGADAHTGAEEGPSMSAQSSFELV